MLTFIIGVAIVFIAVDLFVRFIVEPLIAGKHKKVSKSSKSKLDPTFRLATETMYDGGKPHTEKTSSKANDDEKINKD